MYTTLAFLALLGAPYIYDISSLRVKRRVYNALNIIPSGMLCSLLKITVGRRTNVIDRKHKIYIDQKEKKINISTV